MAVRLGAGRRRPVGRRGPTRDRARRELGRHGGRLRPRAFGGGRGTRARAVPGRRGRARVHQVRPAVGGPPGRVDRERSPPRIDPGGVRAEPAPARRRTDRSLPGALARLDDRDVDGGVLGHDGRARGRGEGSLDRRLQLRRRPARALRGRAPRRLGPAAAVAARARRALHRRAVGGGARRRGARLLPARLRDTHGRIRPRTDREPRDDDWRREAPAFREPLLSQNLVLVERLGQIAEGLGATVPGLAVAWVLAQAGVTASIVGARLPGHVDGWVAAAGLELDDQTLREIGEAIAATGAGSDVPPAPPPHIRAVPDRT